MGFEFDNPITRERLHQMSVEELNHLAEMLEKEVKEKRSGLGRELGVVLMILRSLILRVLSLSALSDS